MDDIRCRYYHQIYINNQLVFSGYLLHEEAWIIAQTQSAKSTVQVTHEKNNTSSKSDDWSGLKR
jgi:hypothetical protein